MNERKPYQSGLWNPGRMTNCVFGNQALSFCSTISECMQSHFSPVQLCVTPWTVAHQAPLSMGLCRQECWSGLPCPPPGDLSNAGIKSESFASACVDRQFCFVLVLTTRTILGAVFTVSSHSAFKYCFHTPGRNMDEGHGACCFY